MIVLGEWPNHIGSVKAIASPAEVILAVEVELVRLPTLQSYAAVDAPPIFQPLHAAAHLRKVVTKDPAESVGQVEVRRRIFALRTGAVLRLGCVWLKVFSITGIVHGARPGVVHD